MKAKPSTVRWAPPIAQDQGYDMEKKFSYRSSRVNSRKNVSVDSLNRKCYTDSTKVSVNVEENSGLDGNPRNATKSSNKCMMVATIVIAGMLILAVAASCTAFTLEVSKLKSSAAQEQSLELIMNSSMETLYLQYLQAIDILTPKLNTSLRNRIESIEMTLLDQLNNNSKRLSALEIQTELN